MNANRKEQFKIRFETHYPRLCQIAFGYVACREDAEDIVQELFVGIWNRETDLMPEKDFAAYITTAVKNSCISFLRKKQDSTVSIDDHPGGGQYAARRGTRPERTVARGVAERGSEPAAAQVQGDFPDG